MTNQNLRADRHDKWLAHNIDNGVLKLRRRRAPHRWVMGGIFEPSWFWTDPVSRYLGHPDPVSRDLTHLRCSYLLHCSICWCSGWYVDLITSPYDPTNSLVLTWPQFDACHMTYLTGICYILWYFCMSFWSTLELVDGSKLFSSRSRFAETVGTATSRHWVE